METYRRLAAMADKVGVDGKEILALLKVDALGVEERGNQGNQVTADVKLTVRVSATYLFGGSGDWGGDAWGRGGRVKRASSFFLLMNLFVGIGKSVGWRARYAYSNF